MQKNSQNFSMQDAMRLANSDAGQRLLDILKQSDGKTLQQAMDQAAAGNLDQAKSALSAMLNDPETKALLEALGGSHGK